jgi:GrpB-like predicted nucleotidyltransferase (UPF0157 family)
LVGAEGFYASVVLESDVRIPVYIVDYDPRWPTHYEEESESILATMGSRIIQIDHIGSTSVPGLGAKPIIDILAGMESQEVADASLAELAGIGYVDVTPEPEEPDWFYCLGKPPHSVGYHLHLMKHGTDFWRMHIVFRDILRANPRVAGQYLELKQALAKTHRNDRLAYTNAKAGFIEGVLRAEGF